MNLYGNVLIGKSAIGFQTLDPTGRGAPYFC